MECYIHCQSCGMPLDHQELFGTEKNVRRRFIESKAQPFVIEKAVSNVHYLARWLATPVNHDING